MKLNTPLSQLHVIGMLEGTSYLLLLGVCMPLKYYVDMPGPTRIVGMAHGILFIAYCSYVLGLGLKYNWSIKVIFLGLVASVLPFGPFVADKKLFPKEV